MVKNNSKSKVMVICGPTASGKSAYALAQAKAQNGIIINADSLQVYQDLPLLTAQPSSMDQEIVPHKLYGFMKRDNICSVGSWLPLVVQEIQNAWKENKLPFVVGGTGLYIKALTEGLAKVPSIPEDVRLQTRELLKKMETDAFYEKLLTLDPLSKNLRPSDSQRMARAYEVMVATGKSLQEWQQQTTKPAIEADFERVLINPPREVLYENCNNRFLKMLDQGALEEVKKFWKDDKNYCHSERREESRVETLRQAQGDILNSPIWGQGIFQAIGLRELTLYLQEKLTLNEAITLAQTATRQYAKRQVTWFKNKLEDQKL